MQATNVLLSLFLICGTFSQNVPDIPDNKTSAEVVRRIVTEGVLDIKTEFDKERDFFLKKIEEIQTTFDHQTKSLRSKVGTLEKEIEVLKKNQTILEKTIEENHRMPYVMEKHLPGFQNSTTDVRMYQGKTDVLQKSTRVAPARTSTPMVAFYAKLNAKITNVGPREIIVFTYVPINIGDNYNKATGIFTCDTPGVYVFHTTFLLYGNKFAELLLVKNGDPFGALYAGDSDHLDGSSTTSLVHLEKNDAVWVKADQYHSSGDLAEADWTYFSGYLLYPLGYE